MDWTFLYLALAMSPLAIILTIAVMDLVRAFKELDE